MPQNSVDLRRKHNGRTQDGPKHLRFGPCLVLRPSLPIHYTIQQWIKIQDMHCAFIASGTTLMYLLYCVIFFYLPFFGGRFYNAV